MNKDDNQLESAKHAFEHWRKTRKKQGKVPDYLWKQVITRRELLYFLLR